MDERSFKVVQRLMVANLVVMVLLAVAVVLTGPRADQLSCERQADVRSAQNEAAGALRSFMLDAAISREQSQRDPGATPSQRVIDASAARRYRADASHIKRVKELDCGGIFPTDH